MAASPSVEMTPSNAAPAPMTASAASSSPATVEAPRATVSAASAPWAEAGDGANAWPTWPVLALLLMAAVAWFARKRITGLAQRANSKRSTRVVETTRLSEHTRLSVIHFKGRELLVAHGSRAVALLVDRPLEEGASKSDATGIEGGRADTPD
jgi:hypothetical protein